MTEIELKQKYPQIKLFPGTIDEWKALTFFPYYDDPQFYMHAEDDKVLTFPLCQTQ